MTTNRALWWLKAIVGNANGAKDYSTLIFALNKLVC